MNLVVPDAAAGERLDRFVARSLSDTARAQIQRWIIDGYIRVQGVVKKPAYLVRAGERIELHPPEPLPLAILPEPIPLDIVYEDSHLVVVNKAAGMVVHPGAGQLQGTLVNALLAHCHDLTGIGDALRPGIVHRLDKGTSGAIVVAKSQNVHQALVKQFQARTIEKIYVAMVIGKIRPTGTIESLIGRHPTDRKRMSTRARHGKPAITHWRVTEYFGDAAAWVEVNLATGRTHQIRVHLSAQGHPLIGDVTYGGARGMKRLPPPWHTVLQTFQRPALHAWKLAFQHPITEVRILCEAPFPSDVLLLAEQCRALARA